MKISTWYSIFECLGQKKLIMKKIYFEQQFATTSSPLTQNMMVLVYRNTFESTLPCLHPHIFGIWLQITIPYIQCLILHIIYIAHLNSIPNIYSPNLQNCKNEVLIRGGENLWLHATSKFLWQLSNKTHTWISSWSQPFHLFTSSCGQDGEWKTSMRPKQRIAERIFRGKRLDGHHTQTIDNEIQSQ